MDSIMIYSMLKELALILIQYYAGPSRVLCGRDALELLRKVDLNTSNDGASAKASPFHALIVLEKKRLSILASCMANLSKISCCVFF